MESISETRRDDENRARGEERRGETRLEIWRNRTAILAIAIDRERVERREEEREGGKKWSQSDRFRD